MNETFGKKEKLKSEKLISKVFAEGSSLTVFPLKLIYLKLEELDTPVSSKRISLIQAGVTVPKRNFQKAVERVHLKRLMRESYRKNKYLVHNENLVPYAFMFLYLGKEKIDYHRISAAMQEILQRFVKKAT